jgi:hypothetical protein
MAMPGGELAPEKRKFGQQTPRRWGWGTPLKKRPATRTKIIPCIPFSTIELVVILSINLRGPDRSERVTVDHGAIRTLKKVASRSPGAIPL